MVRLVPLSVIAATLGIVLSFQGCTPAQQGAVQAACAEALPLANLALGIPTVGPFVAAGVQVGCATAAGITKLESDPSSAAWLGEQIAILKAALGKK